MIAMRRTLKRSRRLIARLRDELRDDRGAVTAEYAVVIEYRKLGVHRQAGQNVGGVT